MTTPVPFHEDPNLVPSTLVYELMYRKEGHRRMNQPDLDEWGFPTDWVRDRELDAKVPDVPPNFAPVRGSYETIAKEAVRLNATQQQSGFSFFHFFPDVLTEAPTAA